VLNVVGLVIFFYPVSLANIHFIFGFEKNSLKTAFFLSSLLNPSKKGITIADMIFLIIKPAVQIPWAKAWVGVG